MVLQVKIRCAWCKRITGDKPPYGGKYDEEITDGICPSCLAKYFPEAVKKTREKQDKQPL